VIGAVLIAGANALKLATRAMLKSMKRGAVIVDVAIDQGGCFETSHARQAVVTVASKAW
jgi:alanine dehydrogenase